MQSSDLNFEIPSLNVFGWTLSLSGLLFGLIWIWYRVRKEIDAKEYEEDLRGGLSVSEKEAFDKSKKLYRNLLSFSCFICLIPVSYLSYIILTTNYAIGSVTNDGITTTTIVALLFWTINLLKPSELPFVVSSIWSGGRSMTLGLLMAIVALMLYNPVTRTAILANFK